MKDNDPLFNVRIPERSPTRKETPFEVLSQRPVVGRDTFNPTTPHILTRVDRMREDAFALYDALSKGNISWRRAATGLGVCIEDINTIFEGFGLKPLDTP